MRTRAIARVEKTHGKRGEVVTVPVHGLPPLMRPGIQVALVPPRLKGPRWREVTAASDPSQTDGQLVSLAGIAGLGQASELVGRTVLAREEDLPADLVLHDAEALVGRQVSDLATGQVGTIAEVMRGPAQDVWVIEGLPQGEVMVPVVPAFVDAMPADGPIPVRLPGDGAAPTPSEGGEAPC